MQWKPGWVNQPGQRYGHAVPSVLAGQFRRLGPVDYLFHRNHCIDRLETIPGAGFQDFSECRFPDSSRRDFSSWLPHQDSALGMGQHQDHCLGLLHYPSFSLDGLWFRAGRSICAPSFSALFFSGFVTLFGGLAAGRTGFGVADRAELDAVGVVVKKLPADARYAGFPTGAIQSFFKVARWSWAIPAIFGRRVSITTS